MNGDDPRPLDPFAPSLGGDWKGRSPRADNPMTWSLPICRLLGLEVRIHALFLALILVETTRSAISGRGAEGSMPLGMSWTLFALAALWFVVLLHELAHCLVARRLGGFADEILIWPLGGLAAATPPRRWGAHAMTAAAGPVASGVIYLACAVALWSTTRSADVAFPIPFTGVGIIDGLLVLTTREHAMPLSAVYLVHCMNTIVLLANLLPILPFDGGRFLHALLWSRLGYVRAMRITERVGVAGVIVLGLVAVLFASGLWSTYLIALAFFCGLTCLRIGNAVEFTEEELGRLTDEGWAPVEDDPDVVGRIGRPASADRGSGEELDRILAKIKDSGLNSLTRRERRTLKQATRQRRK